MEAKAVGALLSVAMDLPKDSAVHGAVDELVTALRADYHANNRTALALAAVLRAASNPKDSAFKKVGLGERLMVTTLANQALKWLQRR